MPNPFHYSKAKHTRKRSPSFKNYRQYKSDLREEFAGQCVYCRALDAVKGRDYFGVDHYKPKGRFPRAAADYANLFYSCNRCNALKGPFWPSSTNRANGQFVPNPCDHVMFEHLRFLDGVMDGISNAGLWASWLMDINDPDAVALRKALVATVQILEERIRETQALVDEANGVLAKTRKLSIRDAAMKQRQRAERSLQRLQDTLDTLLG